MRYLVTGDDGFRQIQDECDAQDLAESVERIRERLKVHAVQVEPIEEDAE